MDNNAQDIVKQSAEQMGSLGKSSGSRLARLARSKVGKWIRRLIIGFLKQMIASIGKVLLATLGPWGIAILIAALCFLAVLEAIPGSDWFLLGGSRTEEMIAFDIEYENRFKELADESVEEIGSYRADEIWKNRFKELVKPSWGIPAALARYQIMRADPKPIAGEGVTLASSEASLESPSESDSAVLRSMVMEATAYGPDCPGCTGITATGVDARRLPTPRVIAVDPNIIPLHSRVEVIVNGNNLGVFSAEDTGGAIKGNRIDILYPSQLAAKPFGRQMVTVNVLQWGGTPGYIGTWTPSLGAGIELPDVNEMYEDLKPVFTYKTISTDVERWKTVVTTCTENGCTESVSYRTVPRPSHDVLDWVWTPYGDITVPSLKKYWTSPQLIGREIYHPETNELIEGPHSQEDWSNNKGSSSSDSYLHLWTTCSEGEGSSTCTSEYYQFENTEVNDLSLPAHELDTDRLYDLLVGRGVKEVDVPIVYQWAAAADPSEKGTYFYAGQFKGVNNKSRYTDYTNISDILDFEFSGEIKNGWTWPVQGSKKITSTFGPRWGSFHYGVDLGGREANGYPIVAARDGVVVRAEYSTSYGNVVYIAHDDGLQTRYAHMETLTVSANQRVAAGTMIGTLGSTGRSTGPHLHFEVMRFGKRSPLSLTRDMERVYDPMVFLGQFL